jgi:hypothetical protein
MTKLIIALRNLGKGPKKWEYNVKRKQNNTCRVRKPGHEVGEGNLCMGHCLFECGGGGGVLSMEWNGIHQLLISAVHVNLLGDNTDTIRGHKPVILRKGQWLTVFDNGELSGMFGPKIQVLA